MTFTALNKMNYSYVDQIKVIGPSGTKKKVSCVHNEDIYTHHVLGTKGMR